MWLQSIAVPAFSFLIPLLICFFGGVVLMYAFAFVVAVCQRCDVKQNAGVVDEGDRG